MKKITQDELQEFLRKHKLWLADEPGGERADLCWVNLSGANLHGANLHGANLSGADLYGADLSGANLSGANLRWVNLRWADLSGADLSGANLSGADLCWVNLHGANLHGANLRWANLYGANLSGANLSGANLRWVNLHEADLSGADLSGADLSGANLSGADLCYPIACPEEGSFIAFKKCRNDTIVKLLIPEDAKRCSATSSKCRCDKAVVLEIQDMDGNDTKLECVASKYDKNFVYRVGETVSVDNFDENRWNECAPGIHFYIARTEALNW